MNETVATEDIYDQNGILLLAKGQKKTAAIMSKLKMRGCSRQDAQNRDQVKEGLETLPIALELGERINIRDTYAVEYSNKILSSIIFESKTKPWWMLINALSNYVSWIYTHSIDVAVISLMIAVELELSDEELRNIGLGSFLHDIGMLLIPKPIIQKPIPLNDMEKTCIRQHCELGMSTLKSFGFPKESTDIVMQHHERLDGSGYPAGLKGDEISRGARIVMIADVMDAITSGRPYKQVQEMDTALAILKSDEGKYFKEYVSVLEKILI